MKTYSAKLEGVKRLWWVVDAKDVPLGRLATEVACLLQGKGKPIYTPHIDTGDFVIVINAEKVKLTGKKLEDKKHFRHSGYVGGIKATNYSTLLKEKPVFVVEKAVKGMLPKNKLGRAIIKKLKVYRGSEHPHQAQNPKPRNLAQEKEGSGAKQERRGG